MLICLSVFCFHVFICFLTVECVVHVLWLSVCLFVSCLFSVCLLSVFCLSVFICFPTECVVHVFCLSVCLLSMWFMSSVCLFSSVSPLLGVWSIFSVCLFPCFHLFPHC